MMHTLKPASMDELRIYFQIVERMLPPERLELIAGIANDWDGYRDAKNLGELIDEIYAYAIAPYTGPIDKDLNATVSRLTAENARLKFNNSELQRELAKAKDDIKAAYSIPKWERLR